MSDGKAPPLAVGSTIWLHDTNRREYDTDQRLIFRRQFVAKTITAETSQSWLVDKTRIPKRGLGDTRRVTERDFTRTWYLTKEAVENECWIRENNGRIWEAMRVCRDAEKLKQIASLLNVVEAPRNE